MFLKQQICSTVQTNRKTCLLNILAGRSRSRGKVSIHADVRWNNYMVDPTNITVRKQIAFVDQDNSLPVTSTPREAIRFSAKLRLSRETSEQALNALTERMIAELGLSCCADTIIGNGVLIKGISGGERKRTSVGVELIVVRLYRAWHEISQSLSILKSSAQLCGLIL